MNTNDCTVKDYNLPASGVVEFILARDLITLTAIEDGTRLTGSTAGGRKFTTTIRHTSRGLHMEASQDFRGEYPSEQQIHDANLASLKAIARAATPDGTISLLVEMPESGGAWHESSFVIKTLYDLGGERSVVLRAAIQAYDEVKELGGGLGKRALSQSLKASSGYWGTSSNI